MSGLQGSCGLVYFHSADLTAALLPTCWLVSLSSGTAAVVFRDLSTGAARTPTHVPGDNWDAKQSPIRVSRNKTKQNKTEKKIRVDYLV